MSSLTSLFRRVMQLPAHIDAAFRFDFVSVFPLLSRDLTEQAARPRTYIVRVIYATVLYVFAIWVVLGELGSWSPQSFAILGRGRPVFLALGWFQFIALYLFLPAITCGALTSEKERETLSLLLLTRLGPWSILIGKLLSRLVTMGTFLCLSLPLVAVVYGLGGFEASEIIALAWALIATALQISGMAMACSAWCRTTASAFLSTYLLGALIIVSPFALLAVGIESPARFLASVGAFTDESGWDLQVQNANASLLLFGPATCLFPKSQNQPFGITVLRTLPMLIMAGSCLLFARAVLWPRAFLAPSNYLLRLFRSLDALFHSMNQNRLTRGIVLTHEHVTYPVFDPIRWRETKKRSLGTTRYLVRLLLALEVPVLFGMLFPYSGDFASPYAPAFVSAWVLWVVATLVITIHSTGLIGAERSRQTLDVLLTTPMTSETIVREKFAGIWRMIRVLWIPLATVYLFQIWWSRWVGSNYFQVEDLIFGLLRGLLAMVIYPPLIAWIGFHFSMRCRSQTKATLVTLCLISAVCVIPAIVADYLQTIGLTIVAEIRWLSPATVLWTTASSRYFYYGSYFNQSGEYAKIWAGMLVHFVFAGVLLLWLWSRAMRTFARHVNRNDGQVVDDDDIERLSRLRQQIMGSGLFQSKSDDE